MTDIDHTLEARLADAERERDGWKSKVDALEVALQVVRDDCHKAEQSAESAEAELVLAEVKVENICDDNDVVERERDRARAELALFWKAVQEELKDTFSWTAQLPSNAVVRMLAAVEVAEAYDRWHHLDGPQRDVSAALARFRELSEE